MTRQGTRAKTSPRAVPDDYKRIHGIGPAIEKRLHSAGICTYAELAALPAEAIASLVPALSAKQIAKQGWIPQARNLVPAKDESRNRNIEPVISTSRQHYEIFTFEFLLDEKNKIRRLRAVHVQSGDVDTWARWDARRLFDFLTRHTGTRLPYPKTTIINAAESKLKPQPSVSTEQFSDVIAETTSERPVYKSRECIDSRPSLDISKSTPQILETADHPPSGTVPQQLPSPVVSASTVSRIHLLEWKTFLSNTNQSLNNLPHNQAFDVHLTLDLTSASLEDTCQIDFTASLYAKKLGGGLRQVIAETHRTMPYANTIDLTISNATLPQGLYRLEALLTLIPTGPYLMAGYRVNASFQGGLFQVY
jgi:hypothetical protein